MKTLTSLSTLTAALLILGCSSGSDDTPAETGITDTQKLSVLTTYAEIAEANYNDALSDAQALQTAIDTFAATPTDETLAAAQSAWLNARESYGTTEAFRLSGGPIDAEEGYGLLYGAPEGQINAWPLDENMIDYTETSAGAERTSGNIIDTVGVFTPGGDDATAVDVTTITADTLASLNENGGDANVASGYHAIEFLLWGQDQDYESFIDDTITPGATTAGERPVEDFTTEANAARRLSYLQAAAELLVSDLTTVAAAWTDVTPTDCTTLPATGCYRAALLGELEDDAIAADDALKAIFSGLGVFVKSELANERIAVAVLTPSEEDEHSCFSDNTHRDIVLNYEGFKNILLGEYGGTSMGTSIYSLLDQTERDELDSIMASIDAKVQQINDVAVATEHFDYQIKEGSSNRATIVSAKNEMRDLGDEMVNVAAQFDISLTEDDVTDPAETQI